MVSAYSCCVAVSAVSNSSPVIPMTPFMGVRISWLMVARNSALARLAASAASLACCKAISVRWRSAISRCSWALAVCRLAVRSVTRCSRPVMRPRNCVVMLLKTSASTPSSSWRVICTCCDRSPALIAWAVVAIV